VKNFIKISAASLQTLALDRSGKVHGWGSNQKNRLGLQNSESIVSPTELAIPSRIVEISCGYWHSLALSEAGKVYSCGNNKSSELGRLGNNQVFEEVHLPETISNIEGGFGISFFIGRDSSALYSCGKEIFNGHKK